ncbi:MAG: hypothetical protein WEE66_11095 [Actinomycetota bacterium]
MKLIEDRLRDALDAKAVGAGQPVPIAKQRVRRIRIMQATYALLSVSAVIALLVATVFGLRVSRTSRPDVAAPAIVGAERLFILDTSPGGKASEGAVVEVRAGPTEATVVERYPLGSDPDAVLSPDGSRLFGVAFVWLSDITTDDRLRVFDTSTGKLINEVDVPDWQGSTGGFHISSKIAVAQDGGHVYILVGAPGAPDRPQSLATFDAVSGTMLPEVASLDGCGAGPTILPLSGQTVMVVCPQTNEAHFLTIGAFGVLESSQVLALPVESDGFVSGAVLSPNGETVYAVSLNGLVLEIDTAGRRIVGDTQLSLPGGHIVAVPLVRISPTGESLFVGLSGGPESIRADLVMEVNVSTWKQETTSTGTFSAFEPASDGSRIFMVNSGGSALDQFATDPAVDLGGLGRVADEPQAIIVAPTP